MVLTEGEGREFDIDGAKLCFDVAESSIYIHAYPCYRANTGFFQILGAGGEWLLLKSCYDDAVRHIKSGALTEGQLMEISRLLLKIENVADGLYETKLLYNAGEIFLIDLQELKAEDFAQDMQIPRPLTATEYAQSRDGLQSERALYSRSISYTVLPESLSYLMSSLVKKSPDFLGAFFQIFDAKVGSPVIKLASGRAYLNITALLGGFKETRLDVKLFAKQYFPWQRIFDKEKSAKAHCFISLRITDEEVTNLSSQLEKAIKTSGAHAFFEEDYFTPAASLGMGALMLSLMFQELWLYFARLTGQSPEAALKYIYLTRTNSFFVTGARLRLPDYFDLALEAKEFSIEPSAQALPLTSVPTRLFRRKKSLAVLKRLHFLLTERDKLLRLAGDFHQKNREILIEHGDFIKTKKSLKSSKEVFNFDLEDIRKLVNGSYFANLEPMREYRTNYASRLAASYVPYELYEADIPLAGLISEEQLHKMLEKAEYACHSTRSANISGVVNGPDSSIVCDRSFPLRRLSELKEPKALITDIAPAFSYVMEYCLMHDVPLYSGLRYSKVLLDGKGVELGKQIAVSG